MRRPRRGPLVLACVTALLLPVSAAQAQTPPDRSVDDYRNAARRALHGCSKAVAETAPSARARDAASARCAAEAKSAVAGKFDAAMVSTMDPAVRAALQRHQAAFITSLAGIAPLPGEASSGYLQRQTGLRCALSHAWTDIEQSEASDRYRTAKGKP
ncbi:hypothetical protein [Ramlibacter sp. AN1133]|uniref:hypothetical protein n=1 Tax=Ramlibacter sp. AN1133 TaxID=3133429 RepID=UPI0030C35B25